MRPHQDQLLYAHRNDCSVEGIAKKCQVVLRIWSRWTLSTVLSEHQFGSATSKTHKYDPGAPFLGICPTAVLHMFSRRHTEVTAAESLPCSSCLNAHRQQRGQTNGDSSVWQSITQQCEWARNGDDSHEHGAKGRKPDIKGHDG